MELEARWASESPNATVTVAFEAREFAFGMTPREALM